MNPPISFFCTYFLLKVNPVFFIAQIFCRNKFLGKNCKIFSIFVLFYLVLSLAIVYCNKDNNRWCVAYTGASWPQARRLQTRDYRLQLQDGRELVLRETYSSIVDNNTRHIPGDSARLNTMRVVSIIASVAPDYAFQLRVLLYHLGGDQANFRFIGGEAKQGVSGVVFSKELIHRLLSETYVVGNQFIILFSKL